MPEATSTFPYVYTPDPPKKAAVIKVSCGIGDTDGFPAFDVDSDAYAAKDDPKWGFLITGGAEFHMPLTVFQVTPEGLADKGGIRLGDIILEINEEDATELTLTQAHEQIEASGKKIHFLVKNMEEDPDFELGEEKSIVLRVPKPMPPPKEFTPTPLLGTRFWHPIMWHDPPEPPKPKKKKTKTEVDEEGNEVIIELSEDESSEDEEEKELPHHRIIRNIRRFFAEVGDNRELKERTIEDMLLALPSASRSMKPSTQPKEQESRRGRRNVNASNAKRRGGVRKVAKDSDDEDVDEDKDEYDMKSAASIEARLREMQRKLSEIAEIPKILSSTLATVSQTFEKLNPSELKQQYRKHSYDEDALDYELSGATTAAVTANGERRLKLKAKGKANSRTTTSPARGSGGEKLYLAKDPTPESDYASEGNYESNEADTDDDDYVYDGDVGESGGSGAFDVGNRKYKNSTNTSVRMAAELVANDKEACVAFVTRMRPVKSSKQQQQERKQYQQHQYRDNVNVSEELEDDLSTTEDEAKDCDVDEDEVEAENSDDDVVTARLAVDGVSGSSDDDDDEVDDVGDDDDDDENDFLTATYTWSLSKIPKLRLNDEKQSDDESSTFKDQIDMNDTDEEKPNKKARWCHTDDDDAQHEKPVLWAEDADEKEKKFADKLERSWPWADREKIIYKQSTCHLVRRRPLGLVEQRIKLLAKQNLSDSLERQLQH